jgi:hypothetical protein
MNQVEMLKIVEQFSRNTVMAEGPMKVTRVPDSKTMHIETIGEVGRSVFFNEYKVDGEIYWAGYSTRSDTVYVSQKSRG